MTELNRTEGVTESEKTAPKSDSKYRPEKEHPGDLAPRRVWVDVSFQDRVNGIFSVKGLPWWLRQ